MKKKSLILIGMIMLALVFSGSPSTIVNDGRITNKEVNDNLDATLKSSEWKSGFNYTIIDNYPYSWIEINETGTNITDKFSPNWDDGDTGLSFSGQGWNFTFYGTEYDTINVSTNGLLSLSGEGDLTNNYAYPIPQDCGDSTYDNHNDTVFLFNTDLSLDPNQGDGAGSVFYEFKGTAPNRYLVIEYFQVNNFSIAAAPHLVGDFEAILYENGDIKFQYKLVKDLIWYAAGGTYPVVGLDHGDLIHYSNYTGNWTNTFSGDVEELAVYFRLSKISPIFLPSDDDDDDDDDGEVAVPGFDLFFILLSALLGLVIMVKKFRKKNN